MDYQGCNRDELIAEVERLKQEIALERARRCTRADDAPSCPVCFRSFVDACRDAVFELTPEGEYTYINPAGAARLGHAPDAIIGRPIDDFFDASTASWMRQTLRETLDGECLQEFEHPIPLSTGVQHMRTTLGPVRDRAGQLRRVVGYGQDISRWRERELAALDEAHLYRTLAANIPGSATFVFDSDMRYVLAEGPELAVAGWGLEDVEGKHVADVVSEATWGRIEPVYRKALAGESSHFEMPAEGRIYEVHVAPLRGDDGDVAGGLVFVQNITERRAAETHRARHDAILEAVRFAGQVFLASGGFEDALTRVVQQLGEAAKVSRVVFFLNEADEQGRLCARLMAEWCAEGIGSVCGDGRPQPLGYEEQGLERIQRRLSHGQAVHGLVRDFPSSERGILEPLGIKSTAIVPVLSGTKWWGFVGFDDCDAERVWSGAEIAALKTAASLIGSALERRDFERSLREARDRLSRMFDTTLIGIAVSRAEDGCYVEVNAGFCEMTGYAREELLGCTSLELGFLTVGQREALANRLRLSDPLHDQELIYYTKQGQLRTMLFSISSLQSGGEACYLAVMADITERKRAEGDLARERAFIRTIIDTDPNTIFVKDEAGNFVLVNQTCADLFGTTLHDLTGRTNIEVLTDKAENAGYSAVDKEVIATGEVRTIEELHKRQDGGETWFYTTKAPITLPDGRKGVLGVCADLTERKRAELELERREAELRKAQEVARLGSWSYDSDTGLSYWSDMLYEITGVEPDTGPLPWEMVIGAIHPDDVAGYEALAKRCLEAGIGYQIQLRMVHPNGELVYLDVRGEPEMDAEGRVVRVTGTAQDITPLRQAYEKLRESENRFRVLVESVGEGIGIVDEDEEFAFVNPAAAEIFGVDQKTLLGLSLADFVEPKVFEFIRGETQKRKRGEESTYEHAIQRADGERRQLLVTAVPQYRADGGYAGAFAIFRDITERKRAEEALRESEARYRAVVSTASSGIILQDAAGQIVAWNQAAEELLGLSSEELDGQTSMSRDWRTYREDGSFFPGSEHPSLVTLTTGQPCNDVIMRIQQDSVRSVWVSVNTNPIFREETGKPTAVVIVFTDITRLKESQEALRESEARYRDMFEKNRAVKLMIDPEDGRIVEANSAAAEFYGYPKDVLESMRIWDINCLTKEEVERRMQQAAAEKTMDFVFPHRLASGEVRQVEVHSGPIESGGRTLLHSIIFDVTEQQAAETALRDSQQRFLNLFENAPVATFEEDFSKVAAWLDDLRNRGVADLGAYLDAHPDALDAVVGLVRILNLNEETVRMFEADSKEEVLGALSKSFPAESLPFFRRELEAIWEGRESFEIEFSGKTFKGNPIEYLLRWSVPKIEDRPGYSRVIVAVLDITERKRAEEALRISEELFSKAFRGAPLMMTLSDPEDGRYIEVNEAFVQQTGYAREEVLDTSSVDLGFISLEGRKQLGAELRSKGHVHSIELALRRADGTSMWALYTGELIRMGGEERLLSIAIDITERRAAQEALRASEHEKNLILNSTEEIFAYYDLDFRIQWVNQAAARIVGLTPEDLVGRRCYEVWQNREAICPNCPLREVKETGQAAKGEMQTPDGRYWFLRGYPVLDEDGSLKALVELGRDITEQKEAQTALQRYAEAQELLLREVNHRVKNNLMALRGMLGTARQQEQLAQNPVAAHMLESLDHRLTTLLVVHQMLSSSGWEPVSLDTLLHEVCNAVARGSAGDGTVEVQVCAERITIEAEQAHQLALAINELVTNTLKHGVPGGAGRIEVDARRSGPRVEIVYRDDGSGFPAFAFKGAAGQGVGLSLLRHVVEGNLGGIVKLSNAGGAEVRMEFALENR